MTKMQRPLGSAWAYLDRNRPRRAVFYGRVSTEHEAQLSALDSRIRKLQVTTSVASVALSVLVCVVWHLLVG